MFLLMQRNSPNIITGRIDTLRGYVSALLNTRGFCGQHIKTDVPNMETHNRLPCEIPVRDSKLYGYHRCTPRTYAVNQSECCKKTIPEQAEGRSKKEDPEIYKNYEDVIGPYDCHSDATPSQTVTNSECAMCAQKKTSGNSGVVSRASSQASQPSNCCQDEREYAGEPCQFDLCDCPICDKKPKSYPMSTISSASCQCETCVCTACVRRHNKKSKQSLVTCKDICDCCTCKACEHMKKLQDQLIKEVEIETPMKTKEIEKKIEKEVEKISEIKAKTPPRIVPKVSLKPGPCSCEVCRCLKCHDENARHRRHTYGAYDMDTRAPENCARDSCKCLLCEAKKLGQTVISYNKQDYNRCATMTQETLEKAPSGNDASNSCHDQGEQIVEKDVCRPSVTYADPCVNQTVERGPDETCGTSCANASVHSQQHNNFCAKTSTMDSGHSVCDCAECGAKIPTQEPAKQDKCICHQCPRLTCGFFEKPSVPCRGEPSNYTSAQTSSLSYITTRDSQDKPPLPEDRSHCGKQVVTLISADHGLCAPEMQPDANISCANSSVYSEQANNVCANLSTMDCACPVCNCVECRSKKPSQGTAKQEQCSCRQCPHVMCGFYVKPKARSRRKNSTSYIGQMDRSHCCNQTVKLTSGDHGKCAHNSAVKRQPSVNKSCANTSVCSQQPKNICANLSTVDCVCPVCNCVKCRSKKLSRGPTKQQQCSCGQCPQVKCGFYVKPKAPSRKTPSTCYIGHTNKKCEPYIQVVTVSDTGVESKTRIALDKGSKVKQKSLTLDIEIVKQKKGDYVISVKNSKAKPTIARANQMCHDPHAPNRCDLCKCKDCSRIKLQNPEVNLIINNNMKSTEDGISECQSIIDYDTSYNECCDTESKPANMRNNASNFVRQPYSCCMSCHEKQNKNCSDIDKRMTDASTCRSTHLHDYNYGLSDGNKERNDYVSNTNCCSDNTDFKHKCAAFVKTDIVNNCAIRKLKDLGNNIIREQYLLWLNKQPKSVQSLVAANDKLKSFRSNNKPSKNRNQIMAIFVDEDFQMNLIDGVSTVHGTCGSEENDLPNSKISSCIELRNCMSNGKYALRRNVSEFENKSTNCNNISTSQSYDEYACNQGVVQSLKDCIMEETKCCGGTDIENGSGEFKTYSTCSSNKYCHFERDNVKKWNERILDTKLRHKKINDLQIRSLRRLSENSLLVTWDIPILPGNKGYEKLQCIHKPSYCYTSNHFKSAEVPSFKKSDKTDESELNALEM